MKILSLNIEKIRGITELTLNPEGENFLVWGPNGTGKSAVVDALDFLLTGRISRLEGEGTKAITLRKHGTHIDADPRESVVSATVKLINIDKPITISRCIADPQKLICEDITDEEYLQSVIDIARRGQHVLSRREILKFITAKPGDRAEEIQTLLNITEIETIRKGLVKTHNNLKRETINVRQLLLTQQGRVTGTLGVNNFSEEIVIAELNNARLTLKGEPITELLANKIKENLSYSAIDANVERTNPDLVNRDIEHIKETLSDDSQKLLQNKFEQLQSLLQQIFAEAGLFHLIKKGELIQLGLKLIDDTGDCPLCGLSWESDELKVYLIDRLSEAKQGQQLQTQVYEVCGEIQLMSVNMTTSIDKIVQAISTVDFVDNRETLINWLQYLNKFTKWLKEPFVKSEHDFHDVKAARRLFAPSNIMEILSTVQSVVKEHFPPVSKEQTAWDLLTRLEADLEALEEADSKLKFAVIVEKRGEILKTSFEKARNETLESLYNHINDKFTVLYRDLHGEDEKDFNSTLIPDGSGLKFEVDFYGRGSHPPHALHSEGHQDSMGLCLYLALSEHLTKGFIDLTILDDVLMSVDSQHRREVITVLNTHFSDRQFLITTHDKTWARELRHSGLIKSSGFVEFVRWNVDTGPIVHTDRDMWIRIEQALQDNDINLAAFLLRSGSEHYFEMVCDRLQAQVTYRAHGDWGLGDYLPSAQKVFSKLIKKGKEASLSWKNDEMLERLKTLHSVTSQINTRVGTEQWKVNPNVHYNKWADFLEDDFRPVVEAFHDLFLLFQCSKCQTLFEVLPKSSNPEMVKCSCGEQSWSLTKKYNTFLGIKG